MKNTYRSKSAFGKRIEYHVIGKMLTEGIDVYIPLVDDHGVDAIIKKSDGTFIEIQIKARSKNVLKSDAALFAGIEHEQTNNYYFVFYSQILDKTWIMSSKQFINRSRINKKGKNKGKRNIQFNGMKNKNPYAKEEYNKYLVNDFSMFY